MKLQEDGGESGAAMSIVGRKVGAAEEGLQLRCQPDTHRPSSASRESLNVRHVESVDIGSLLAVDLHVDEMFVHQAGNLGILKGLMGHHVAPVAGGVTDGEEDGLLLPARSLKGFLSPRVPCHWVRRMLEQIGGGAG